MLKNLEKYSAIKKECRKIHDYNIVDILLFGSAARGRIEYGDVDICIIFRNKIDLSTASRLAGALDKERMKSHVSSIKVDEFFSKPHSLIRALMTEGISLLSGKKLSDNFGLDSHALYTYSLTSMKTVERVKFVFLLKGRGKKGIIEKNDGFFLAPSCFIVPIRNDGEIKEILDAWNVKYTRKIIMLTK